MFCSNCGTKLPDEANFCWRCGKSQKPGIQVDVPKWEVCEITVEDKPPGLFGNFKYKFIAKAVGPEGVYVAGETKWVARNTEKAIEDLVAQLVKDKWEPTGKGEAYYNYKFKRRVN